MKSPQHTKIIVGLSGGVDSAVTAFLLKEQGYDVEGCYMQNWMAEKDDPFCSAEKDLSDAKKVCDQLQIPFHLVNFSKEYWGNVFEYCLDEWVKGRTPNPDIWCNQFIKFDVLLKHALNLGADFLATGHYARKTVSVIGYPLSERKDIFQLEKAVDRNKDQTYFLYTLNQERLSKTLFPLGELTKPEVRDIAKKIGLNNAEKKDSTGICFIGERKFVEFLKNFVLAKPGVIKTIEGDVIGKHDGLMFYTLGQRKGLKIGGVKNTTEDAWFVVNKEIATNTLIVAQGHNHPALFSTALHCEKCHWISGEIPRNLHCTAKIRYRQEDQPCKIELQENHTAKVVFDQPQRAVTPGQSIVFYDHEICLGGAIIVDRV